MLERAGARPCPDGAARCAARPEAPRMLMRWLDQVSWTLILVACATIGLSPFAPPHLWEKLQMLAAGELSRPLDWFDLVLHGAPWALLFLKAGATFGARPPEARG